MSNEWRTRKLRDIADIRVSNVDKKVYATETPVKLCNYMDVYANDYVTGAIDFMPGSANRAEVDRFGVLRGDVIITKDSETPDDIGVPAVVIDDIPDLVCGYHLCLIRPKNGEVDSVYLAKQLATSRVMKYFAVNASGSTRYGLPIGAIEGLEVPFAPEREQSKIAEILSTVDRAIEQTAALIAKQQRIKTGLMQDLLTRGIDEQGNLRSEETHHFKDSPLGRIPVEWDVQSLRGVVVGGAQNGFFKKPELVGSGFKLINVSEIYQRFGIDTRLPRVERVNASAGNVEKFGVAEGDIFFTRSSLVLSGIAHCNIIREVHEPTLFECHVMRVRPECDKIHPDFLALYCQSHIARVYLMSRAKHVTMATISQPELEALIVPVPKRVDEQAEIAATVLASEEAIIQAFTELTKLQGLKTALMQDLLTGEKRVTPLLEPAVTN